MFVSPDAGALKKIYDIAKFFKVDNVVTAAKVRNISTGEIVKTELPPTNFEGIEQVVIIDDIKDTIGIAINPKNYLLLNFINLFLEQRDIKYTPDKILKKYEKFLN